MFSGFKEKIQLTWRVFLRAAQKFSLMDGDHRAAAFAYYAFFSLFPLILLFVTVGSLFVDRDRAVGGIISYVESYVPIGAGMRRNVFDIISGVVNTRGKVGVVASVVLLWGALGFFTALIRAVERAWDCEVHNWWRMPLKSSLLLAVMASALMLGLGLPVVNQVARHWILPARGWMAWFYKLADILFPLLVQFYGLSLFYKLAPRRPTRFAEVWPAALLTSVLLRILESLFVIYLQNFARFNALESKMFMLLFPAR
jgi:Ca2+-transporting ATPase